MREDEERAAVGTADHQLERAFGNVDPAQQRSGGIVDEHLPVRDVEIARRIARDAAHFLVHAQWASN